MHAYVLLLDRILTGGGGGDANIIDAPAPPVEHTYRTHPIDGK